MLLFKRIRWKNFLSTGREFTEFDFQKDKTTLVIGQNGAGKSTLLDALAFVLYGSPYRKLTQAQLINSINKKDCLVEIEFETGLINYKIRRGLKPKVFEVYREGILVDQQDIRDYQSVLENDILKINLKSFSQIVIVGSANYVPFMKLTTPVRRGIVEDILDLSIFSTMNELLKDKIKANKEAILENDNEIRLVKSKIEINRRHIESMKESSDELIAAKRVKIKEYEDQNETLSQEIKTLQAEVAIVEEHIELQRATLDKFAEFAAIRTRAQSRIEKLQKEISFYEHTEVCPTCSQEIDSAYRSNVLVAKREKLQKQQIVVDRCVEHTKDEPLVRRTYNAGVARQAELSRFLSDRNFTCKQILNFINDLLDDINLINKKTQTAEYHDESVTLSNELDNLLKVKEDLIEDKEVLAAASQLLKDGGIKSLIIKQYIPEINKIVNQYLQALDFFVQFELDENFNETIKSRFRDEFSYENFSEGEKARIDLSLLFTWREIAKLRNSISTNLLILDEVFDGSMDDMGSDELMKLLKVLTEDSNVVIISHDKSLLDKFDNVIRFKKVKNFSVMETL
jgi:DNA repair exonuclease SbcCD ATPase subunit